MLGILVLVLGILVLVLGILVLLVWRLNEVAAVVAGTEPLVMEGDG